MPTKLIIARDFEQVSAQAAALAKNAIRCGLAKRPRFGLGLATGQSPTGLYQRLADAANAGEFASEQICSYNLDEYVGLPGRNAQERALHPESYGFFMIGALFSRLHRKFEAAQVPWGALIEQERLEAELAAQPGDWTARGGDQGQAIEIRPDADSAYLRWVRTEMLDGFERLIAAAGGIDLQVLGIGERGHVGFHEAGIPFAGSRMLLVRLDENTIANAVADGHFPDRAHSPRLALSLGAELIYEARQIIVLASGPRKTAALSRALLGPVTPAYPISYGQTYAARGGQLTYIVDEQAAGDLLTRAPELAAREIACERQD